MPEKHLQVGMKIQTTEYEHITMYKHAKTDTHMQMSRQAHEAAQVAQHCALHD